MYLDFNLQFNLLARDIQYKLFAADNYFTNSVLSTALRICLYLSAAIPAEDERRLLDLGQYTDVLARYYPP